MKRIAIPASLLLAGAASAAPSLNDAVERGRRTFQRQCAPCHGQGPGDDGTSHLPGTTALERKYKGEKSAALERRADLDGTVIRLFVRGGSGAMPMFRKPELSDAAIDDIAAYLTASALKAK